MEDPIRKNGDSPKSVSYRDAGVDKAEGYRAVERMKKSVAATQGPGVLGGLGAFASLYSMTGWKNPVLVSGTDGVGTKLRLALDAGRLDVIGRDCYAMVANDILCHGAAPLFFLDYLACGKLDADTAAGIVEGMAQACLEDGCALVGGETAEMPGFYAPGDYDVAGFCVGAVEREDLVDGSDVQEGDVVIGLASDGVHSNGFSLVRTLIPDTGIDFGGRPILETLLVPTRLYGRSVRSLIDSGAVVRGMAHITGGGIPENLPRAFAGKKLEAILDASSWDEPEIFSHLRSVGVEEDEMRGTFNMGIGFILIVRRVDAEAVIRKLRDSGEKAYRIGELRHGAGDVWYA
ncbi:MAG: phosphoribosylformylglycinamidine cyclo-ligase [Spirochaetaceae bacterium]|nr:phosphoribosylformylglycinamidine cyclo-ligase [Spirochaetaceae bacterium]MDT8298297.1 phosphoribosylformylglycinamidine cyclo-ligase [Spirochaetaceae bacterium]